MDNAALTPLEESIDKAVAELESLAGEIRVKLHLAGMDANVTWNEKLEPRIFEARAHAREARTASKHVVEETLAALKAFYASI